MAGCFSVICMTLIPACIIRRWDTALVLDLGSAGIPLCVCTLKGSEQLAYDNIGHLNLRLKKDQHKTLQTLAAKEHISVSQLVRRYIDKGMELDGYQSQMETIRSAIREELASQLKPRLERVVKINYKGSLYAVQTAYLCAMALEGLVPPSKMKLFGDAMDDSLKAALSIMDNAGIRRDHGFLEGLWTNERETENNE